MQDIEFTIVLTPPLVITADGDWTKEVFYNFPHQFHRKIIIIPQDAKEKERAKKLKRSSDMVSFTFTVATPLIKATCNDIANEIFRNDYFSQSLMILVESVKDSFVISLSGINAHELAEKIQEIVTAV